jgi:hypothetical protein
MTAHLPPGFEAERQKTEGWVAEFEPVGRPEDEFRRAAEAAGFEVSVIVRDGQAFPVRTKLSPRRVHVRVADGHVTAVEGVS